MAHTPTIEEVESWTKHTLACEVLRLEAINKELLEALKRCASKLEAQDLREGLPQSAELEAALEVILKAEGS